jgi:mannose-6-phosphate isomerase-like protein (cupin superfamily)
MIIKSENMPSEIKVAMRGGDKQVIKTDVVGKEQFLNLRLFSRFTLVQGSSIGYHDHVKEVEYYYILSGEGIVTESDGEKTVKAGDVVITGWGAGHSIRNEKPEDLVFLGIIAVEKQC